MNEKLSDKRILFVGLNTVDLQFMVNRFPDANTKTKAQKNEIFVGGPATNAAIACAHLGSRVDLYTPIGEHTLSDFILEDLKQYSIRIIDPLSGKEGEPVFASIITSQHNGDRTIFSYHPEKNQEIQYDNNFRVQDYSMVLFDGFHPELALDIARQARRGNILTILDGGSWKPGLDTLLKYIEVAICSNDFKPPGFESQDTFDFLHKKGVRHVAITRGGDSILLSSDQQKKEIEIDAIQVIDTLGAGDIFHGAFCHYYDQGNSFIEALNKASKVAAKSCQSFGTRAWMR